jgi:Ca2+-binding EF-hand superfamily protein
MVEVFSDSEIMEAFQVFDMNSAGYITADDLYKVMPVIGRSCTIEEAYKMIESADIDRDGMIGYNDFVALLK